MHFHLPTCKVGVCIFVFLLVRSVCVFSSFSKVGVCIFVFLFVRPVCGFSFSYL